MLFTKGAGSGSGSGGNGANKVVAGGKDSGGKESGGIVIYSVDDDGGVGECDDEDLRLLESMGSVKTKATDGERKPTNAAVDAVAEAKGRIHITPRVI